MEPTVRKFRVFKSPHTSAPVSGTTPTQMKHDQVYRIMTRFYPEERFEVVELWVFDGSLPTPGHKCQIKFRGQIYQADEFGACIRQIEFEHGEN